MSLSKRFSRHFSGSVRNRGQSYSWQRRVRIHKGTDSQVAARVRGSQNYEVSLELEGGVLTVSCGCPYFETDPCKHLWATILDAEKLGYLRAADSSETVFKCRGYEYEDDLEFEDLNDEDESLFPPSPALVNANSNSRLPAWRNQLVGIAEARARAAMFGRDWPAKREIIYVVDVAASIGAGILVLDVGWRDRKADGSWTRFKRAALKRQEIARLPQRADREILASLRGGTESYGYSYPSDYAPSGVCYQVLYPLASMIMAEAARTGRCFWRRSDGDPNELMPLAWDDGAEWRFKLEMGPHTGGGWAVSGVLHRGEERMDLTTPILVTHGGLVFTHDRVAPMAEEAPFEWVLHLRKAGPIKAPAKDKDQLLGALLSAPNVPPLEVPEELRYEEITLQPRPCLRIRPPNRAWRNDDKLRGELSFEYEGRSVPGHEATGGFYDAEKHRLVRRDVAAEDAARAMLSDLGLKFRSADYYDRQPSWALPPTKLPRVARALVEAGWHIEAEGRVFRRPGALRMEVATGVDWFELRGGVAYGDTEAKLPQLLEALRRGESMVRLDDGTYGVLPEEWLRRIGMLAGLGTPEGEHVRFRRSQAGLLDALLASQPEARCDETFTRIRKELRSFDGVEPAPQPAGFVGHLRDYQRDGLGWMDFLRRFSFGGCLADDMGVGKTAQVLALLETRRVSRTAGEQLGPSLAVVPRSLVFNWIEEAARFTPQLRVLDHTGQSRSCDNFSAYDLILTTYGTLRRDVLSLKEVEFDYVILDEAQAIKNASTESAKAARLLRAAHRLALSGTPVENHLGELWSLFEYLNPGMLGSASVFKLTGTATRAPDDETRRLLAHALRPFILRRTKSQVARELPPKTEQTVHCEMDSVQRQLYNELRQHYREALLKRIETEGLAKSKIMVLEALLRLRQAACHPGLLDPKRRGEPSAKLVTLIESLREVIDEGHKALVFSQFTSLLSIVRDRLKDEKIPHEYLDGSTRDRQTRVERFQNDSGCPLFLISLKAGGLGLNLTAAEYVFLLDPWWNPAVEAQAMDRAHRIGQTKQVFAYRLIARDTVEEKVLELQKTKRDLAAAIIGSDNSLIRDLRREDLELLLS